MKLMFPVIVFITTVVLVTVLVIVLSTKTEKISPVPPTENHCDEIVSYVSKFGETLDLLEALKTDIQNTYPQTGVGSTTLKIALDDSTIPSTIVVNNTSLFFDSNGFLKIGNEIFRYLNIPSPGTFGTIGRGVIGTSLEAHPAGFVVEQLDKYAYTWLNSLYLYIPSANDYYTNGLLNIPDFSYSNIFCDKSLTANVAEITRLFSVLTTNDMSTLSIKNEDFRIKRESYIKNYNEVLVATEYYYMTPDLNVSSTDFEYTSSNNLLIKIRNNLSFDGVPGTLILKNFLDKYVFGISPTPNIQIYTGMRSGDYAGSFFRFSDLSPYVKTVDFDNTNYDVYTMAVGNTNAFEGLKIRGINEFYIAIAPEPQLLSAQENTDFCQRYIDYKEKLFEMFTKFFQFNTELLTKFDTASSGKIAIGGRYAINKDTYVTDLNEYQLNISILMNDNFVAFQPTYGPDIFCLGEDVLTNISISTYYINYLYNYLYVNTPPVSKTSTVYRAERDAFLKAEIQYRNDTISNFINGYYNEITIDKTSSSFQNNVLTIVVDNTGTDSANFNEFLEIYVKGISSSGWILLNDALDDEDYNLKKFQVDVNNISRTLNTPSGYDTYIVGILQTENVADFAEFDNIMIELQLLHPLSVAALTL